VKKQGGDPSKVYQGTNFSPQLAMDLVSDRAENVHCGGSRQAAAEQVPHRRSHFAMLARPQDSGWILQGEGAWRGSRVQTKDGWVGVRRSTEL